MTGTFPKIAYLISCYPAISHTFIFRELAYLRKNGIDVLVTSINPSNIEDRKQTEAEKAEVLRTFYVKKQGFFAIMKSVFSTLLTSPFAFLKGVIFFIRLAGLDIKKLLYYQFYFLEALVIGVWMKNHAVSHLHVHFANPASTVALITSKIFGITFSITVHGPDEFYDVSEHRLKEKIEGAGFLCCIGHYAKSQLMKISNHDQWNKLEVAPLGVDPEHFSPRIFRANPSPFTIVCVGRLVPAKGQSILIEAIEKLVKQEVNVHLHFVGDGPDRRTLENETAKKNLQAYIDFKGALNQAEILDIYKRSDLFVLPSFAEGIPVSLMEAMSMEIPCISTYVNGIPELIRNQIDGILVIPADSQELATAILSLVNNPILREQMGKAGRQRILEKYSLQPNFRLLKDIFARRLHGS